MRIFGRKRKERGKGKNEKNEREKMKEKKNEKKNEKKMIGEKNYGCFLRGFCGEN